MGLWIECGVKWRVKKVDIKWEKPVRYHIKIRTGQFGGNKGKKC